jgi:hypothetical protein
LNDKGNESAALNNLGLALRKVRRFEEAITAHQDAAAIFRETGGRRWENMVLGNRERYRADQAIESSRQEQ